LIPMIEQPSLYLHHKPFILFYQLSSYILLTVWSRQGIFILRHTERLLISFQQSLSLNK